MIMELKVYRDYPSKIAEYINRNNISRSSIQAITRVPGVLDDDTYILWYWRYKNGKKSENDP